MQARVRHAGWVFPRGKKDSVGKTPILASISEGVLTLVKTVSLRGAIDLTGGASVVAVTGSATHSPHFDTDLMSNFRPDVGTRTRLAQSSLHSTPYSVIRNGLQY